jgi:hypothetical protein
VRLERTPDGRRFVAAREVDAPPDRCWDLLVDTTRWPAWGPSVRAVDCDQRVIEDGTTGRVRTVGGIWLPFEVTSCRERRWTWRVARIPATGHRVRAGPPTTIEFEIPLVAAPYVVVCLKALQELAVLSTSDTARE